MFSEIRTFFNRIVAELKNLRNLFDRNKNLICSEKFVKGNSFYE